MQPGALLDGRSDRFSTQWPCWTPALPTPLGVSKSSAWSDINKSIVVSVFSTWYSTEPAEGIGMNRKHHGCTTSRLANVAPLLRQTYEKDRPISPGHGVTWQKTWLAGEGGDFVWSSAPGRTGRYFESYWALLQLYIEAFIKGGIGYRFKPYYITEIQ